LLVGTYDGLCVADINKSSVADIKFTLHRRDADRRESLSSSLITNILRTTDGRYYVATGDGGINEVLTANLRAQQLSFRHYNMSTGFPSDIIINLAEQDGALWATAPNQLIELQLKRTNQPEINSYLLRENPKFANCAPCQIAPGKWMFGGEMGAMLIDLRQIKKNSFEPPLIITGVSKENQPVNYAEGWSDIISLSPEQRNLTINFSALDYDNTELVAYAYRLSPKNEWIYLGHNHSLTLAQMRPGTYQLTLRSTNNKGVWCNNERCITIIVTPTFWETPWAILLILTIIGIVIAAIVYTLLYIRRIKRKQHETMEAYLALLEERDNWKEKSAAESETEPQEDTIIEDSEDDLLMKRVVAYLEDNLGNSDLTIQDIAQAVAVSRTSLHRKMKQIMGTSPMEFLREARIRKAAKMLTTTTKNVSEIAYFCGFSDPKYFSKCFKATFGMTPSEYKQSQ
jgi:AraC-like DNA-binding protein